MCCPDGRRCCPSGPTPSKVAPPLPSVATMNRLAVVASVAALVLGACTQAPTPSPEPSPPSASASSSAPPVRASSPAPSTPVWSPTRAIPTLEVDGDEDPESLGRAVEFYYRAGRYSGGAFDADAVVDELRALGPQDAQEWITTLTHLMQGDLAADYRLVSSFAPTVDGPDGAPTAPGGEPSLGRNHFAIVLDASGSMAARSGSGNRMTEAKAAIQAFVPELPANSTVSLRVYGHEGDNSDAAKAISCAASEVVFSGAPDDGTLSDALRAVQPTGWTPLAASIEKSAGDIPGDATDAIVYVVTDGIETCGGDPVAAASSLAKSGVKPIVNVIGFDVEAADQAALKAIAESGGGRYADVSSGDALRRHWAEERERMRRAFQQWRAAEEARIRAAVDAQADEAKAARTRLRAAVEADHANIAAAIDAAQGAGLVDAQTHGVLERHFESRRGTMEAQLGSLTIGNSSAAYVATDAALRELYAETDKRWSEFYAES